MVNAKLPITACILTKDSMPRVKLTIDSIVDFIDEILVADQESKDGTAEYCESNGANIIRFPRNSVLNYGLSYLRNDLISKAKNEFVLIVDSDEIVSPALRKKLCDLFNDEKSTLYAAYSFFEYAFIDGKRIKAFDGYSTPRLLDKKRCRYVGSVHEKVVVSGDICQIDEPLYHVPYETLAKNREKALLYGWLSAKEIAPNRSSYYYQFKDMLTALSWGILRQNAWLDGRLYLFMTTSMMKTKIWAYYLARKRDSGLT